MPAPLRLSRYFYKDLHKTLISEELAELNGLKIGDTITFSSRLRMMGEAPDTMALTFEPMNVEIVGIFRVNGFQPMGEWVNEADITYNWLLTDAETVKEYSVKHGLMFKELLKNRERYLQK